MQLPDAAAASQVGSRRSGAGLDVKIHGVEPAPRPRYASGHASATQKIILNLGVDDYDTKMCNLDANCYDAELRSRK